MNRKPPELPNIEDATLRACLAPLMEAMTAGVETAAPERVEPPVRAEPTPGVRGALSSNDNPPPAPEPAETPSTLAGWRALSEDDFGVFRTIALFLAMPDGELTAAAAQFPKQIGGTVARIREMKRRLADQCDTATIAIALLERALARAEREASG